MAITEHAAGTYTFTAIADTWIVIQTPTPELTDGAFQIFVDAAALIAGDTLELSVLEKVISTGTAREFFRQAVTGVQSLPGIVTPTLILLHGWDFRMRQRAGAVRAIPWSIRKVV